MLYIEHPDSGELHDQEKSAIAEMDAAINEVDPLSMTAKVSAITRRSIRISAGFPASTRPPELLNKAHDNVQKEDDSSGARERAMQHIG